MTRYVTGKDDPALADTAWPMPETDPEVCGVEWRLRYGRPDEVAGSAAVIVAAYFALITEGTTTQQLKRLAALRRVHRRRAR